MAQTLLEALLNIQHEAPTVQAEGFNDYTESHFMELKDVVAKVTPMLNEEGLLWEARPSVHATVRAPSLKYSLTHVATKEAREDEMLLMLPKGTPQDLGSAITYARRYALVCVLNLVVDKDDDGHSATQAAALPEQRPESEIAQAPTAEEQKDIRQTIVDLATELQAFPEAWGQTEEWANQREIDLGSPPADKLRAVERALRSKLERTKAEQEKKDAKKGS